MVKSIEKAKRIQKRRAEQGKIGLARAVRQFLKRTGTKRHELA